MKELLILEFLIIALINFFAILYYWIKLKEPANIWLQTANFFVMCAGVSFYLNNNIIIGFNFLIVIYLIIGLIKMFKTL